jgi:cobalt/nickel transport protein
MKITTKLWIGIIILVALSPLGLLLPEHYKAGAAWGEWGVDEIKNLVGYIPGGLEKFSSVWNAPISDYAFKGWEGKGLLELSLGYILSAVMGIIIVVALIWLITKVLIKK